MSAAASAGRPDRRRRERRYRILYAMSVDWRWIKQRPHYIAEGLVTAEDPVSLLVAYIPAAVRGRLTRNRTTLRRIPLPTIAGGSYTALQPLNRAAARAAYALIARLWRPDAVWVSGPESFDYLPSSLRRRPLAYDAMDVAGAMNPRPERRARAEAEALRDADVVFAASEYIARTIEASGAASTPIVVRNAFDGHMLEPASPRPPGGRFRLGYVGTIGDWVDTEMLLAAVELLPNLEVHLVGPVLSAVPGHDRLRIRGPIDHADLHTVVADLDATILPYRQSELTLGVDPVKLYEYVAWRRPVLAVRYPEISYAEPYVCFYTGLDELVGRLGEIMRAPASFVASEAAIREFLDRSTWTARLRTIRATLRDRLGVPFVASS